MTESSEAGHPRTNAPNGVRPANLAFRSAATHAYIVPAFGVVLTAFVWLVTYGTWGLGEPEFFGQFYDAQAASLLAGHWDVPPHMIASEAFVRDGKTYGYFGFAPALLRVPLYLAMPPMRGLWSRLFMTAACAGTLVYVYLFVLRVRELFGMGPRFLPRERAAYAAFVLTAGLGSSLIFLASRAYVFHEASIWGGMFALACYVHVLGYALRPTWPSLLAAAAAAFLAFFSRASVGSGAVLAILLLIAAAWRRRAHAGAAGAVVVLVAIAFVAVNYAKFRTYFDATPLRLYGQMIQDPSRLERTGGKHMSLGNVRSGLAAYFSPTNLRFAPGFPWVYDVTESPAFPEARYDLVEPFASLPASAPALCGLGLLGVVPLIRCAKRRGWAVAIPVVSAAAGGLTVTAADAISRRYLHDFFPLLVVAGAFGLHAVLNWRRTSLKAAAMVVGAAGMLFSIYANTAVALYYQRAVVWGVPRAYQREYQQWQQAVDRHFVRSSPT